jgi:hypothetical protein
MKKLVFLGVLFALATACTSTLSHYGPEGGPASRPEGDEDGSSDDVEALDVADSADTGVVTVPTETDTDTDTDADADTDADTDTDTDTPTTTTTTPPAPSAVQDGHYTGTVEIDYTNHLPLIGGSGLCTGRVVIDVDQSQAVPVVGTVDCDWPPLNFWAQVTMNHVSGVLEGYVNGSDLFGATDGEDGNQVFVWSDDWTATVQNDRIEGTFDGGTFLVDSYTATFTATLR